MMFFISLFSMAANTPSFVKAYGFAEQDSSSLILNLVMFIHFFNYNADWLLRILINQFSVRKELQADAYAVQMGYGRELKSSLISLGSEDLDVPFQSEFESLMYNTHPNLLDRLKAINYEIARLADTASKKKQNLVSK